MSVAETIQQKLTSAFKPEALEVIDESEQHRGHGGWREGGETHFRVRLKSAAFIGLSRVAQQRSVHKVLAKELDGPIHALALELATPGGSG